MSNFVLIPGAWMGAWVWDSVADGLRALGHSVHPVTLSGLADGRADASAVGLETHVRDVLAILDAEGLRDAVVVGHSYSGIVAGQAADRAPERVSHTVFVDAFLPRDGASMLDAFGEGRREEERQISENGGRWPAPGAEDVAREPDLSPGQARGLAGRLVGHPGRTVSEPAVLSRSLARQRATYVLCAFETSDDLSALRAEPNWTFRELQTGHWPMVSAPGELVSMLSEIAAKRR
ncbi:MAG TPA: alpha/beta hydrolase [Rubrobacter sp.]|nr:alpha/beta hydrolase [Rubrobacter sp.]